MPSNTNRWSNLLLLLLSECLTKGSHTLVSHTHTVTQHTRIRKARWFRSKTPFGKTVLHQLSSRMPLHRRIAGYSVTAA